MNFLGMLSPALTTATGAVGAYQGAQVANQEREQKDMLQMIALMRQRQTDERERLDSEAQRRERDAQAGYAKEHTNWLQRTPTEIVIGPDGTPTAVEKRTNAAGGVSSHALPGVTATPPNPPLALPTTAGFVQPPRVPGQPGLQVKVNGKVAMPIPPSRGRGSGSGSSPDLVHNITTLNTQISQIEARLQREHARAKVTADQVDSAYATPRGLAESRAAVAVIPQLEHARDSLVARRDALAGQQQRESGYGAPTPPPGAPRLTPAPKPSGGLPPTAAADSARAARMLNGILSNPKTPPEERARAKQAFQQVLKELRSAATPEGDGEDDGTGY